MSYAFKAAETFAAHFDEEVLLKFQLISHDCSMTASDCVRVLTADCHYADACAGSQTAQQPKFPTNVW